jgi:hypothetical protein
MKRILILLAALFYSMPLSLPAKSESKWQGILNKLPFSKQEAEQSSPAAILKFLEKEAPESAAKLKAIAPVYYKKLTSITGENLNVSTTRVWLERLGITVASVIPTFVLIERIKRSSTKERRRLLDRTGLSEVVPHMLQIIVSLMLSRASLRTSHRDTQLSLKSSLLSVLSTSIVPQLLPVNKMRQENQAGSLLIGLILLLPTMLYVNKLREEKVFFLGALYDEMEKATPKVHEHMKTLFSILTR